MFYIKLDDNGQPINHPMQGDNLKQILEVSYIDDAILKQFGYARFEFTPYAENVVTTSLAEYELHSDGVVRNKVELRPLTQGEMLDRFIRSRRSFLLAECDWTQSPDSPLSAAKKAEWAAYRQALRDLTDEFPNAQSAEDVIWPEKPE